MAAYALSGPVEFFGTAKVIDGDTIIVNNQKVRLHGIDAPELSQFCKHTIPCGIEAKEFLASFVGKKAVKCKKITTDKYDRVVATCWHGSFDLGDQMVLNGYAMSDRPHPYLEHEAWARETNSGIWGQQPFISPAAWRRIHKN